MIVAADTMIACGLCPSGIDREGLRAVEGITLAARATSRIGRANRLWFAGASAWGHAFMHAAEAAA